GKRFFLEEFGIENEEAWLPDTFGFAAGRAMCAGVLGRFLRPSGRPLRHSRPVRGLMPTSLLASLLP
ncbi:hypothetical protein AB0952_11420, partial [Streptomyces caniferus]